MRKILTAVTLGLWLTVAQAMEPDELVRQTTEQVLEAVEKRQAEIKQNPDVVYQIAHEIALPHFDFELMSRLVLGRHWKEASEAQQSAFVDNFRQLLLRTYGTSLSAYSGQKIVVLPIQGDTSKGRATVRSEILQDNGPKIPLAYQLRRGKDGWKVFDVVIDGLSLVQNYRSSFAAEIQRYGIDGLVERLQQRNREKRTQ